MFHFKNNALIHCRQMGVSKPTVFKEILIGYQFSAYISYRKVIIIVNFDRFIILLSK